VILKPLLIGEQKSRHPGLTGFLLHKESKFVPGVQVQTILTQNYSPEIPSATGLSMLSGGLLLCVTTSGPSLLFLLTRVTFAAGAKLLFLKASWRFNTMSVGYNIFQ